ncbi:Cytochrome P450 71A9, partial [Nymphaea thermarum]
PAAQSFPTDARTSPFNPTARHRVTLTREEKVGLLLRAISTAGGPMNLSELLLSLSSNIICRVALGKKYNHEEGRYGKSRFQDTLATFQDSVGAFFVGNFFPSLKRVELQTGLHGKLLSQTSMDLSFFLHQLDSPFSQYSIAALLLPLLLSYVLLITWRAWKKSTLRLPPGPWPLPIIGNLHQLGTSSPHRSLHLLSLKHGPLMLLKLGSFRVCVVSSAKLAEEVMKVHDLTFFNRPEQASTSALSYGGSDIAFQPYGQTWRHLKKIAIMRLLNSKKVSSFKSVREEEVGMLLRAISTSGGLVNLSELLLSLSSNIICRIAFGNKGRRIWEKQVPGCSGDFASFAWDFLRGGFLPIHGKLLTNLHDLDLFYDELIRDHSDPRRRPEQQDFVDSLLDAQKDRSEDVFLTVNNIKGMLMDIFIGGTETASATLVWAMAELMRKPEAMKKLQDELRSTVKTRYLKLVIKETLRQHPPLPLLVPRVSSQDCNVGGYSIPAETRVIVNVWAIGRDPNSWQNPEEFIPERFINSHFDYKGKNFEFIPFGSGRRMCPGIHFAMAVVELVLANLIYCFDWELPCGKLLEDINMIEAPGSTVHKRDALKDRSEDVFLTVNNIKGMLMNIFIGGTDTASATLVWAMAELMRKPEAMKKLQDELRSTVKTKDMVEENDLHQLQYLKLVIKETLRHHPAVPLLVPRVSSQECNVGGYSIPAETRVIVNAWAIGRDPNSWKNPEEFIPERFVNSHLDYKGQNFEFIPFGSGRRMCPGHHFAMAVMELVLANLIYCFDWELPCGKLLEDIDMIEAPGSTVHKRDALRYIGASKESLTSPPFAAQETIP